MQTDILLIILVLWHKYVSNVWYTVYERNVIRLVLSLKVQC